MKKRIKDTFLRRVRNMTFVVLGLFLMILLLLAFPSFLPQSQVVGISFSAPQASGLGLHWKEVYTALLDDMRVRHLRLSAYWNDIQPRDGEYDFSDLDYQMQEAEKRDTRVILSIGRKLPRWPECHIPEWAKNLSENEQQKKVLDMLAVVVDRYKTSPVLDRWQLENEPLLTFGICPPADREFLKQEERIVREHDVSHKILITDSGELNSWLGAGKFGDELGTTMYRTVFSNRTQKLFHYDYLFPSWLYRIKSRYVYLAYQKPVIISELQGEPWGVRPFKDMSESERMASFSPDRFSQLWIFAQRTQLPEVYWWGAEYWYWEKMTNHNDAYWEMAKRIFRK